MSCKSVDLRPIIFVAMMWPALASAAAPVLTLHIRADKSEYVLGEPVRLTVTLRNCSSETLALHGTGVFCSVTSPRGVPEYRAGFDGEIPATHLASGDSVLFFVYPNIARDVTSNGARIGFQKGREMFESHGRYQVRILCQPRSPGGACFSPWITDLLRSNEVTLSMRSPRRNEARVIDALRRSYALGDSYRPGYAGMRHRAFGNGAAIRFDGPTNDDIIQRLRVVRTRVSSTPLVSYVDYGIARMLLDGNIEEPRDHAVSVAEGIRILEELRSHHPEFRPDEVSYHLSMALFRCDVWRLRFGDRARARAVMTELMEAKPDLWSNPEFATLAETVSQEDSDIEVRLQTDRREYVIGEPMLFRVTLINKSSRTVRAPGPALWTTRESDFVGRIEIERPDGKRELRTSYGPTGEARETYAGMPLAPGDSVVSIWDHAVTSTTTGGFGYYDSPYVTLPCATAGTYRLRAGLAPSEWRWRAWGAGRLTLSDPVEIDVRAPNKDEARIVDAIRKVRVDNIMGIDKDGVAIRVLADASLANKDSDLNYHARRGLAWAYTCWGPNRNNNHALAILDSLEHTTSGIRKAWVQQNKLSVLGHLWHQKQLGAIHIAEARRLIASLEQSNPTIWATDNRFIYNACHALYGEAGHRLRACWSATLIQSGSRPASPLDLDLIEP